MARGFLVPVPYESLAKTAPIRQRLRSAFVHQTPSDEELTALRRSTRNGLPFGASAWVKQLSGRLGRDLTIRPRGRPRKLSDQDRAKQAAGPKSSDLSIRRGKPFGV